MLATISPFPQYFDLQGSPLDAGYLYFGQVNQNPETAPVTVYWDAAGTQPAAQPIRTNKGMIVRNGTPAIIYAPAGYSLTVKDSAGRNILYAADSQLFYDASGLSSTTDPAGGAGMVGFSYSLSYAAGTLGKWIKDLALNAGASFIGWVQAGASAVTRTVENKIRDIVSVKDFGAIGDGVTNDTAAIQAAINSGASRVIVPKGKYKCSGTIEIKNVKGFILEGDSAAIVAIGTTYEGNSTFIFDSAPNGTNGLLVETFVGVRVANISISQNRSGTGGGYGIYLKGGHDFQLDNVKVHSNVGSSGAGMVLGNGTGAGAAFTGCLRNVKIMTGGEVTVASNASNTSLNFDNCYFWGGVTSINGTIYSSFNACAFENSNQYGCAISNCKSLVFNGCGGEANAKGVFYLSTGSSNIILNAPIGVNNNTLNQSGFGDLVFIDSLGGPVFNVTINSPVSLYSPSNTTNCIYATANTQRVVVNDAVAANLSKGIGGDTIFVNSYLNITGPLGVRPFVATQGVGWTFSGTPAFTSSFARSGNGIHFTIDITGFTSASVSVSARIILPFSAHGSGSCAIYNDNAQLVANVFISGDTLYIPAFSSQTVPLHLVGYIMVSE